MKIKELNQQELIEINGGYTTSSVSFSSSIGTGSLISLTFTSTDGDKSQTTTLSVGNNISLFLGGFGTKSEN